MLEALAAFGLDFLGKKQEQRWAKQAAGRQMDFQERMSNTAYQRAMADMRQAGINPLMVTKLGGASTPTGGAIPSKDLSKIGSNAMKYATTASQIQNLNSQSKNYDSQSEVNRSVRRLNSAKTVHQYLQNQQQELQNSITAKNIIKAGELSQWEVQYTPFNQAGSQLLDLFQKAFQKNPDNPNWNRVIDHITLDPRELWRMFMGEHEFQKTPETKKKEIIAKRIRDQIQGKNLTLEQFKSKAKEVLYNIFGSSIFKGK